MRRAGYHVWLVQDLAGSYEQQPPNLLEELQRDRRWCQGNLQNARLIAEPGLHGVHRAMLITGAFAYLSAPLWLAFVLVGAALWVLAGPDAGSATMAAAPAAGTAALQAPLHTPLHLAPLWFATSLMLLLPRAMGVVAIVLRREQAAYGGTRQLLRSVLLETGLSILQAPVRMLAHTVFVAVALTGIKLDWRSPPREASNIGWGDAARRFAPVGVVVGLAWAWAYTVQPVAILWLLPMVIPLLLAVPLAVFTGRAGIGQRLRADALLLTPEEHETPGVLQHAWSYALRVAPAREFRDAIDDPWLFDVVRAAMGQRNTGWGARGRARRRLLHGLLHHRDAERLSGPERMRLLSEPQSIVRLRDQLAGAPDSLAPPMPRRGKNPLAPSAKPRRPTPVPVLLQALGAQRLRTGAAPA
jgi:membrane glycosyltransferase